VTTKRKPPAAGKGRPKGATNKSTREIRAFCRDLFERRKFQRNLIKAWDDLDLEPSTLALLLHYAFGKPAQVVDLNADGSLLELLQGLDRGKDGD